MKFGTWNVRTLMDNTNTDRPERRTAFVARELQKFNFDIVALSETRRAEEGQLKEERGKYTFFWKGKPANQPRIHGVGFAIRNDLLCRLTEQPVGVSERLMTLRIGLENNRYATLISAYAPTLDAEEECKEVFYADLDELISSTPPHDKLIILGDFNARVGKDQTTWGGVIGKNGVGKSNANGILLLSKCAEHNLVITNTVFRQRNSVKMSWQHPRSKHWHLIDYVIVRMRDQQDVLCTRAVTTADECWTDHRLISSTMRLKLKARNKCYNKPLNKKYNVSCLKVDENALKLQEKLEEAVPEQLPLNITEHWNKLKSTIRKTCDEVLGHETRKHQDWFDENDLELKQLIDRKREAFLQLKNDPNSTTKKKKYAETKSTLQKTVRFLKNKWWKEKAGEIQTLADQNNSRAFFKATKEIYGPTTHGQVPMKNKDGTILFKTHREINERWREHFENLLNQETTYNRDILNVIPQQPIQESLSELPTMEEVSKAISKTKSNKAAGPDGIPAEVYKYGGIKLKKTLHHLIIKMWTEEEIPSEWKNANIVKIYKRKGDRSECGNYRGISLLSTAGKILSGILNMRLQTIAESILPESQSGFRPGRGTTDMIFSVRQLQEKCIEQNKPLYMAFIDITKAFDTVARELLWDILTRSGCPAKFVKMVRLMHEQMTATVLVNKGDSNPFNVTTGVKQGCLKAPTLFSIFIAVVLHIVHPRIPTRINEITYRFDGKLFNLPRLKAKTKVSKTAVVEFQYADDNAIAAQSPQDLQTVLDAFHFAYTQLGLKINTKKTQVMFQAAPKDTVRAPPTIKLGDTILEKVDNFSYLGSIISSNANVDAEINHRIQQAAAAFGKLRSRVFQDRDIRIDTKLKVYRAIVITTLLYGSETWTTYRRHIAALEKFHQRCLRRMMNIKWQDKKTNISVLEQAATSSVESIIVKNQLRWVGHVTRMEDCRLPKQMLYSELSEGKRDAGGPKKRFRDCLKKNIKQCCISEKDWERLAQDRVYWRRAIREGVERFEARRTAEIEEKRHKRLERQDQPRIQLPPGLTCPNCNRTFKARIGLYSHYRAFHHL